jgi:hypothetical protein
MTEASLPLALTPEQLAALDTGQAMIHAEDPTTHRRYVLIDEQPRRLTVEELRTMLQEGIDELDRGEGVPWNPDEIKAELREYYRQRGLA